jgi:hypothetical protein
LRGPPTIVGVAPREIEHRLAAVHRLSRGRFRHFGVKIKRSFVSRNSAEPCDRCAAACENPVLVVREVEMSLRYIASGWVVGVAVVSLVSVSVAGQTQKPPTESAQTPEPAKHALAKAKAASKNTTYKAPKTA